MYGTSGKCPHTEVLLYMYIYVNSRLLVLVQGKNGSSMKRSGSFNLFLSKRFTKLAKRDYKCL